MYVVIIRFQRGLRFTDSYVNMLLRGTFVFWFMSYYGGLELHITNCWQMRRYIGIVISFACEFETKKVGLDGPVLV